MTTPSSALSGSWRPTVALLRAIVVGAAGAAVAVVWQRPAMLVLAAPFGIVAAWALLWRPGSAPSLEEGLAHRTVREGAATSWRGRLWGAPELDLAVAVLADAPWFDRQPEGGAVTAPATDGAASLEIGVRSARWGLRPVERVRIVAAAAWAGFRWVHETPPHSLTTLPVPGVFDADATAHPTDGLIGQHRSTRHGEGNEFAAVRPFRPGDRMRRINWVRSTRSGELQVNSTWSDLDLHLALVVDATDDYGVSEGVDGRASSLDLTVRAAGAIAEHYLPLGERVSLRVFGAPIPMTIAPATGNHQLRRVLDVLARVRTTETGRPSARVPARDPRVTTGGQLTVMLSPLVAAEALDHAVALGRSGLPVVVVDTLPDGTDLGDDDVNTSLAWRIRLLERRRELRLVRAAGIPVVAWRGPGSLDQVIRDISRHATRPAMRTRR